MHWFRVLCSLGMLAIIAIAVQPLKAQDDPNFEIGFKSYGSYHGDNIDAIGLSNGSLNINIPLISYGSYAKPRRTAMCDAGGNEAWSYDKMGRVMADQRTTNGITKTFTYASSTYPYNYDGSIYKLAYPSGNTITYDYNPAAQPISAVDSGNSVNYVPTSGGAIYAAHGGLASLPNGSSDVSTFYYDPARLQPCRISVKGSGSLTAPTSCSDFTSGHVGDILDLVYCFNSNMSSTDRTNHSCTGSSTLNNGSVAQIWDKITTGATRNFAYDTLNRIKEGYTEATSGSGCFGETFTIDPWSNFITIGTKGGYSCSQESLSISVGNDNRISTSGYTYDASGNLTVTPTPNSLTTTFDAEGRISTVSASALNCYTYDGDGYRVIKSHAQSSYTCTSTSPHAPVMDMLYWKMGSNETGLETDGSGGTPTEYVFFGGHRTARRDSSGNVRYYFADHLGSASAIADGSGGNIETCRYYPYGGEDTSTCFTSSGNHYKFTGKERDSESGLDDFGARYYSSQYGRFMTPDPFIPFNLKRDKFQAWISNPQHWNKYAYALNNPLIYIDPSGLTETIYYSSDGLTNEQKKIFEKNKAQILSAIGNKLKQAGIKDVVFKDAKTLTPSQVNSIIGNQPKGVALLAFTNMSFQGVTAPSGVLGNTDDARPVVFVGKLQSGNPGEDQLVFRMTEVASHELGHEMGFYSRGETMSFMMFWNKDLMNEGQGMPSSARNFDMSIPQNQQAVDEINKLPEYRPAK